MDMNVYLVEWWAKERLAEIRAAPEWRVASHTRASA